MINSTAKTDLVGLSYDEVLSLMENEYDKGKYHAKLLYENIYQKGILSSGKLDTQLKERFTVDLPPITSTIEEKGTIKFLLELEDGYESETIILPMGSYNTLCISSQIGCRWSCAFCETGKLGLRRNLTSGEILAQLMTAQIIFNKEIRNIVFMGMGEPLDNFDNVIKAIDVISHPWAMNINKKSICISTVGNVDGINRLTSLTEMKANDYHKLHLAVSLNGADDEIRSKLMPVNKRWPLKELKASLLQTAQFDKKDLLYLEYVLIKDITDGEDNGRKLIEFAGNFPKITINLIPFNPGTDSEFVKPEKDELNRFHNQVLKGGIRCFTRYSQGDQIMAGCGQLGNQS